MLQPAAIDVEQLSRRYGVGLEGPPVPLRGGYANDVFRVGGVVARIAPAGTSEQELTYEHELVCRLAETVPEVHAPLKARDGATFIRLDDRLLSLHPFVPGRHADRRSERQRAAAAVVLARIHRAGLALGPLPPRPGKPALADLDWGSNWMWNLDDALRVAPWPGVEAAWDEVREFVSGCPRLTVGVVHGDYFPGNVLVERGVVRAVIDWDGARPEWLVWELARAVWEFAKDKRRHTLRRERAAAFLAAYDGAGGPVPADEHQLLLPFIRCIRLEEVLVHLTQAARGGAWDPWYTTHNWRSLANLSRFGEIVRRE